MEPFISRKDLRDAILRKCTYPGAKTHSGQRLARFRYEYPEIMELCGAWTPEDFSHVIQIFGKENQ